jgi:formylglycine-generating enzyme required for sulfatase activity
MSGNVWEWTRSLWGYDYPYDPTDGREHELADDQMPRVVRGGYFNDFRMGVRCASRDGWYPDRGIGYFGFRLVVAPA